MGPRFVPRFCGAEFGTSSQRGDLEEGQESRSAFKLLQTFSCLQRRFHRLWDEAVLHQVSSLLVGLSEGSTWSVLYRKRQCSLFPSPPILFFFLLLLLLLLLFLLVPIFLLPLLIPLSFSSPFLFPLFHPLPLSSSPPPLLLSPSSDFHTWKITPSGLWPAQLGTWLATRFKSAVNGFASAESIVNPRNSDAAAAPSAPWNQTSGASSTESSRAPNHVREVGECLGGGPNDVAFL